MQARKILLLTQNRRQSLQAHQLIIHLLGRRLCVCVSIHPLVPAGKHDRRALPLRLLLGSSSGRPSRFRTQRFERQIREVRGYVVQAFARRQRGAADGVGAEGVVGPPDELG